MNQVSRRSMSVSPCPVCRSIRTGRSSCLRRDWSEFSDTDFRFFSCCFSLSGETYGGNPKSSGALAQAPYERGAAAVVGGGSVRVREPRSRQPRGRCAKGGGAENAGRMITLVMSQRFSADITTRYQPTFPCYTFLRAIDMTNQCGRCRSWLFDLMLPAQTSPSSTPVSHLRNTLVRSVVSSVKMSQRHIGFTLPYAPCLILGKIEAT